ncbi:hypothetical protein [Caballeronia sp. LZ001]|uniref:hypothetical protein n=1 Tax=Caballeronia sp. LZ001 TaxID=3038553 RepID=UPI00285B5A57|nr:hypothetical protein [Caballeronia sp. LZ001]MDR5802386.1 hypothetical protein [Caballeronia sp. LZ001]
MHDFFAKARHELMKMLPPTLFFFVVLHVVMVVHALMVKGAGLSIPASASVLVASLILGKAVLFADMLPFINRYPERPLIWNAGWKTVIYTLVALVLHYLERLFEFWKETHSLAAAHQDLLDHLNWPQFWAVQILLVTLVFNYCVFAELARVLGRGRLKTIMLGPLDVSPAKQHG